MPFLPKALSCCSVSAIDRICQDRQTRSDVRCHSRSAAQNVCELTSRGMFSGRTGNFRVKRWCFSGWGRSFFGTCKEEFLASLHFGGEIVAKKFVAVCRIFCFDPNPWLGRFRLAVFLEVPILIRPSLRVGNSVSKDWLTKRWSQRSGVWHSFMKICSHFCQQSCSQLTDAQLKYLATGRRQLLF